MPVVTGSDFADALLRPDRAAGRYIFKWQNTVIKNEFTIQDMTRRQAVSRVTREIKSELRDANDIHLQKLRTGAFDQIFLEGARSTSPDFVMLPTDRGTVQRMSLEHYTKMRNARAYAAKDSERFVNHVWEDTKSRHKLFGRNTNYLGQAMFKAGRGGRLGPDVIEMNQVTIDKNFGVKAAMGADGRQWGLERYARLQGDAFAQKLHNLGSLAGADRERLKGKQVVIVVSDGPDCGWTYHGDPVKANGLRVSIEDARANPIAHPHCVRRFSISTKKDDREKMSRQKVKVAKAVKGAVLGAAVTGLSAYAASAVSNAAAAEMVRFLGSQLFEDWLNHLRRLAAKGDITAETLFRRAFEFQERFLPNWDEIQTARARVIDLASRMPLDFKVQRAWPGGPEWSSLPIEMDKLKAAGDWVVYHGQKIPDDAKKFLNEILPGHRDEEQLQLLMEGVHKKVLSRENRANLRSVINAEIQRRNLVYRTLMRLPGGEEFASKVKMTWTSWGHRLRLDPFDWLRGHINFTPSGLIRSLSFFPKTAYRGVIKMYADGSIGGHISALPKNFLNGIFRAIVEIDEHGALVGNLRIVPKGPLKVTLNFITRMPKEVADNLAEEFGHYLVLTRGDVVHNMSANMIADHLVTFLQGHASPLGFRPAELANGVVRHLRDESLIDGALAGELRDAIILRGAKLTFDPRDIVSAARTFGAARVARDLGYVVRQFKFHSAKIEWRIFNKSVFQISQNLRIPLDVVKGVVEQLKLQKALSQAADGTLTGLFQYVVTTPEQLFKSVRIVSRALQEESGSGIKSTLFGGIRMSGLRAAEQNPFVAALRRGNARLLSRFNFDQDGLRSIATNMKLFGWDVFRIADVLSLRVQEVKALVDEGFAQMHLMSYRLGFTKLDDAIPNWDQAVEYVRGTMASSIEGGEPVSRAESLLRVAKAMKNEFTNPADERAVRYLAGILPSDSPTQIRLKLLHLRNWMRTTEAREGIIYRDWASRGVFNPFTGFPPEVNRDFLLFYKELGEFTGTITHDDLVAKSLEMYTKGRRLHLVDPNAPVRGGFDLDYHFGKFQTYFLGKGEALAAIQRNWERLVTNFEIVTRKFTPTNFTSTRLTAEQYATIANWKKLAVEESPTSFRVGETRFFTDQPGMLQTQGAVLRSDPFISLVDLADDEFVKETLRVQLYTRKRFPNLENLPEIRITTDRAHVANAAQFSYLDGVINVHAEWAFNYERTKGLVGELTKQDAISGFAPVGRRYTTDNVFDRLILHETAHWLTDHLTTSELKELVDRIAAETSLDLRWMTKEQYIEARLDDVAALPFGYKTRDPLGSGFDTWRREVILRDDMRTNQAPANLRAVQRNIVAITGQYGSQNIDEMISEAMSHYLYHRDPTNLSRVIGTFYDEKILGRQTARVVERARPVAGDLSPAERDIMEFAMDHEVPSTMTSRFKEKIQQAIGGVDITDNAAEISEFLRTEFFEGVVRGVKNLEESIHWYWTESPSNVRKIRAAWEEMHGIARPTVDYGPRDVVAAVKMDKEWAATSAESRRQMYRGLTWVPGQHELVDEHINQFMKVGNKVNLPFSSFSEVNWVAGGFLEDETALFAKNAKTKAVWVVVEPGARRMPIRGQELDGRERLTEVLSKGEFEVTKVVQNWKPTKQMLRDLTFMVIPINSPEEIVAEEMARVEEALAHRVTMVVLRRVGE